MQYAFAGLYTVGQGIKKLLIQMLDIGKSALGFAGAGLSVMKGLLDVLIGTCKLFWDNAVPIINVLKYSVSTALSVGIGSLLVFGLLAWWFNFHGVIANIKEIVSLIGHPLIKRFVVMIHRLMNYTENAFDWLCSAVQSDSTGFISWILKILVGWWYRPLLCDCTVITPVPAELEDLGQSLGQSFVNIGKFFQPPQDFTGSLFDVA
jgi:hypothetical protein